MVGVALVTAGIAVVITFIITKNNYSNNELQESQKTTVIPIVETTEDPGIDYSAVLREYCETPDSVYSYNILPEYTERGLNENSTTFVLNMTSHAWSTPELVGNGHIWWHYMTITIPQDLEFDDTALLFITGGSNDDSPPDPTSQLSVLFSIQLAERLGMVVATVFQVPNQPIRFPNDARDFDRYEDDIIAFGWRRFITEAPEDPYFLVRMPMTKAAVRAMDTVTNFVSSKINRFYLTGLSKRGWTAWSTAAVDDRVVGIAPQVLDILNFEDNLQHHYRSLKGWTFALEPYWSENATQLYGTEGFYLMVQVSDPFSYRDILTMPKYIITAGNDQFFLPDDSHYFFDQMKGPTFMRIHPNVGHNLMPRATFVLSELVAFILSVEKNWQFPEMSWTRTENETHGEITMTVREQTPRKVTAYRAATTNTYDRRDFRANYIDPETYEPRNSLVNYVEFEVTEVGDNVFQAVTEKPDSGWVCFFIEMEFEAAVGETIRFTSEVNIIPDVFPWDPCEGAGCYGTIV